MEWRRVLSILRKQSIEKEVELLEKNEIHCINFSLFLFCAKHSHNQVRSNLLRQIQYQILVTLHTQMYKWVNYLLSEIQKDKAL